VLDELRIRLAVASSCVESESKDVALVHNNGKGAMSGAPVGLARGVHDASA
jgi:hypothetical protein